MTGVAVDVIRNDVADPLWMQAADSLERDILDGALARGSRLPPERELCASLQISRVTLRKALLKLVDDGLLTSSHGRGWFVGAPVDRPHRAGDADWPNTLESFSETAARLGLEPGSRVLRSAIEPATLDEAEQLGIVAGLPLFHLDRIRLLSGMPIASDRTRVPAALVPGIGELDFSALSLYDVLTAAGLSPARAEATIESRAAESALAAELDIAPGSPVLVMKELVHSADDRALFASEVRYAGDRYRLRTVFTRASRTPR